MRAFLGSLAIILLIAVSAALPVLLHPAAQPKAVQPEVEKAQISPAAPAPASSAKMEKKNEASKAAPKAARKADEGRLLSVELLTFEREVFSLSSRDDGEEKDLFKLSKEAREIQDLLYRAHDLLGKEGEKFSEVEKDRLRFILRNVELRLRREEKAQRPAGR